MEEMKNFSQQLGTFTLPHWDELPDFQLYVDQVITIVNQELDLLLPEKNVLTSAMVNNYVKQKLILAPVKKRYTKEHVALLLKITLLKQILSLPEVKTALEYEKNFSTIEEGYERFSQYLIQGLQEVSQQMESPENVSLPFNGQEKETIFMRSITLALVLKLFSEHLMSENQKKKEDNHDK